MADQGVASSTNFLLNVWLARRLSAGEYGAYSVCFSILLVLAAFHNALILEPMTVVGPAFYGGRMDDYLRSVQRLNWPVAVGLALICLPIAFFYNHAEARPALYALAACVPGYLFLLVGRRKQYVLNQPIRAFFMSVFYAALVFLFIFVWRQKLSAVLAVAALGMSWFAVRLGSKRIETSELVKEHWRYGKWLFASAVLAIGVSDMQTILLSMLVDLKSAGALRALMNFVLPLTQLLTVLSVYALPRLSAKKALERSVAFPAAMLALIVVYLLILIAFARPLERLLYGGKMQAYLAFMPLLAASAFVSGVGASFSTLLRAAQNSQHQFFAGISGSLVGVACAFYLLRDHGIAGALWSMLAANAASTVVILATYWRERYA